MSRRSAARCCSPTPAPISIGRGSCRVFQAQPRRKPGPIPQAAGCLRHGSRPAPGLRKGVSMSAVLNGVRVLDFGRYIAGPFCAALLGDLGAEVIRIERIGGGEDRFIIPVGTVPDGGGAMFLAMNRNKLGMTLDRKSVV